MAFSFVGFQKFRLLLERKCAAMQNSITFLAPGVLAKTKDEFERGTPLCSNAGKGLQDKRDQKRKPVGGLNRRMKDNGSKLVLSSEQSRKSQQIMCMRGLPLGQIPISAW